MGSGGDAVKEVIGDALRNAAMRFGAALDLWHKGDLHVEEVEAKPAEQSAPVQAIEHQEGATGGKQRAVPLTGPIKTRSALRTACGDFVRDLHACGDSDTLEALLASSKPLIDQVQAEAEFYWNGDGADFLGMQKEIERMRAEVQANAGWQEDVLRAG